MSEINFNDYKIVIVDEDADYLKNEGDFLTAEGYNVTTISKLEATLEYLKKNSADILLIDYFMQGANVEELVNELRRLNNDLIIVLQAECPQGKLPKDMLLRMNIQGYYNKNVSLKDLSGILLFAVKNINLLKHANIDKLKVNFLNEMISGISGEVTSSIMSISGYINALTYIQDDKEKVKIISNLKYCLSCIQERITALNISSEGKLTIEELFKKISILLKFELLKSNHAKISFKIKNNESVNLYKGKLPYLICSDILKRAQNNEEVVITGDYRNKEIIIEIESTKESGNIKNNSRYDDNIYVEINPNKTKITVGDR